jgi:hypothetical protein
VFTNFENELECAIRMSNWYGTYRAIQLCDVLAKFSSRPAQAYYRTVANIIYKDYGATLASGGDLSTEPKKERRRLN